MSLLDERSKLRPSKSAADIGEKTKFEVLNNNTSAPFKPSPYHKPFSAQPPSKFIVSLDTTFEEAQWCQWFQSFRECFLFFLAVYSPIKWKELLLLSKIITEDEWRKRCISKETMHLLGFPENERRLSQFLVNDCGVPDAVVSVAFGQSLPDALLDSETVSHVEGNDVRWVEEQSQTVHYTSCMRPGGSGWPKEMDQEKGTFEKNLLRFWTIGRPQSEDKRGFVARAKLRFAYRPETPLTAGLNERSLPPAGSKVWLQVANMYGKHHLLAQHLDELEVWWRQYAADQGWICMPIIAQLDTPIPSCFATLQLADKDIGYHMSFPSRSCLFTYHKYCLTHVFQSCGFDTALIGFCHRVMKEVRDNRVLENAVRGVQTQYSVIGARSPLLYVIDSPQTTIHHPRHCRPPLPPRSHQLQQRQTQPATIQKPTQVHPQPHQHHHQHHHHHRYNPAQASVLVSGMLIPPTPREEPFALPAPAQPIFPIMGSLTSLKGWNNNPTSSGTNNTQQQQQHHHHHNHNRLQLALSLDSILNCACRACDADAIRQIVSIRVLREQIFAANLPWLDGLTCAEFLERLSSQVTSMKTTLSLGAF